MTVHKYTQPFKSLECVRFFLLFLKAVIYAHKGSIYLIKNIEKKVIL